MYIAVWKPILEIFSLILEGGLNLFFFAIAPSQFEINKNSNSHIETTFNPEIQNSSWSYQEIDFWLP